MKITRRVRRKAVGGRRSRRGGELNTWMGLTPEQHAQYLRALSIPDYLHSDFLHFGGVRSRRGGMKKGGKGVRSRRGGGLHWEKDQQNWPVLVNS